MGDSTTMNPERYICVALAALFVVACATDVPPALENEVDLQATWTEAKAEVTDSCKAAQKLVNDLPRGPHCCKKGVSLVTKANQNLDKARSASNDCQTKLTKLYDTTVTFNNVKYSQLKDGKCHHSFFTGSSYRNTKKAIENQKKKCNKKKGEITALKKAVEDTKENRDKLRNQCRTRTKKNMKSM